MLSRRNFLIAASAAPAIARAQSAWPTKPIRWIVNFPPAGAADILSRTLADWFGNRLGQPIVVENKPGAGGMLGADILAKAKGDTHLVMMSSAASHGIGPVLYKDVPYDPLGDFTLKEADFARLTTLVMKWAETYAQARIVSVLEGGYSISALGSSVVAHVRALMARNPA